MKTSKLKLSNIEKLKALSTTFGVITISLLTSVSASSQDLASDLESLSTLRNYQATVLASESSAKHIYDNLPTTQFRSKSQCHQRAHLWTHSLERSQGIRSMKVFLFFTDRYKSEFDYDWGYHVAPAIPTRMEDGSIQNLVFDPTFTSPASYTSAEKKEFFDDKPIPVSKWVRYFVFPEVECPIVENYSEVYQNSKKHYCYLMFAPMYNYIPDNFDDDPTGMSGSLHPESHWYNASFKVRNDWRIGDLKNMRTGLEVNER